MSALKQQAEVVAQKVRHYLISTLGRTLREANDREFYRAFCSALREEIMINWTATEHTFAKKGVRKVYYLSMEYMPGRLFGNNVTNLGSIDLVKQILKLLGRDFHDIAQLEPDIGIGNGGLGRLASCFLDSLATLQYPALGYGMRYQYGIFEQEMVCGVQVERPDCWLLTKNPWEFRQDTYACLVQFAGKAVGRVNKHKETVEDIIDCEEVRAIPYDLPIIGYREKSNFSVLTLRLWSTKESPRNFQLQRYNAGEIGPASENTTLTDVLYPNDNHESGKRIRLKQEFLLLSASLQDIVRQYQMREKDFEAFADTVRIQINDTHPALIVAELMRVLTKEHEITWNRAWEITRSCLSYTNHTVLKEALEEWNEQRLIELLPRQYQIIERLNSQFCHEIRQRFSGDEKKVQRMSIIEGGQVKMAHLAIYGSHKVNGVAALHTDILKQSLFRDFYEAYPDRFINVTNGVTQRRWLLHANPALADFLHRRIGKKWITHFESIVKIAAFAADPEAQQELLAIKKSNKERLLKELERDLSLSHGQGKAFVNEAFLGSDAMFAIHIKRMHEYKRQLMNALHLLMLYYEIKDNALQSPVKRFAIFGGKAAPGYATAKNIIRFIYCLARKINHDPDVGNQLKILFVENYNVSKAELLIPAADLSEQISTASMEASGTGNMKFAMNGALTIGTDDGANVEMRQSVGDKWWPFLFGASAEENIKMRRERSYNPLDIYAAQPKIKRALDSLSDRSLVENDAEHEALMSLHSGLLEGPPGLIADRFFVLNDLMSYFDMQRKVEALYQNPAQWAEYAMHNMAGMGVFSADRSINTYAQKIWGLKKCPPSGQELERVRREYSEHDRCRVTGMKAAS
ncbi:MAG: glycogen/starch/alpha-glucan phosphorylase [Chlamydiota bacterium]